MQRPVLIACISLFAFAAPLAGCGSSSSDIATNDQTIIGGTIDTGDPAVIELASTDQNNSNLHWCTGALISPTVVLTAAHCISSSELPANPIFRVYTSPKLNDPPDPSQGKAVSSTAVSPGYNRSTLANDIAVAILAEPITNIPPLQYLDTALPNITGQKVRLIGYGLDSLQVIFGFPKGDGIGTKRQVTVPLAGMTSSLLQIGASPHGACYGDSGGPMLWRTGSSEYIVGVTSFPNNGSDCTQGANYTRVDQHLTWLHNFVPTSGPTKLPNGVGYGTPTVEHVTWGQLSSFVSTCNSADMAMSPECMSAYKRFCGTIQGDNSGFGPVGKTTSEAAIVCHWTNMEHALFSDWDTTYSASCNGQGAAGVSSGTCATAMHRYCQSIGMTTGYGPVEHSGDAATLACLNSFQAQVRQSTFTELMTYHPSCNGTTERWGGDCNAAIDRLCQAHGFVSGFGPVENSGNNVNIVCVTDVTIEP